MTHEKRPVYPPGIYEDLSNDDYHGSAGLSKSGVQLIIDKTPAHFKSKYIDGEPDKKTPALVFGSAFHTHILEPHLFSGQYAVNPGLNLATKAGKAWKNEEAAGREVLKKEEGEALFGMRESVLAHKDASRLLAEDPDNKIEASIFVKLGGFIAAKIRPDLLRASGVMVDLKSAKDASPEGFSRAVADRGYHIQEAFYRRVYLAAFGEELRAFYFVAVEKTPPYAVGVYCLLPDAVALADEKIDRALEVYEQCLDFDDWFAYPQDVISIDLPYWEYKKQE